MTRDELANLLDVFDKRDLAILYCIFDINSRYANRHDLATKIANSLNNSRLTSIFISESLL